MSVTPYRRRLLHLALVWDFNSGPPTHVAVHSLSGEPSPRLSASFLRLSSPGWPPAGYVVKHNLEFPIIFPNCWFYFGAHCSFSFWHRSLLSHPDPTQALLWIFHVLGSSLEIFLPQFPWPLQVPCYYLAKISHFTLHPIPNSFQQRKPHVYPLQSHSLPLLPQFLAAWFTPCLYGFSYPSYFL